MEGVMSDGIPKYPYRVMVETRIGERRDRREKSFEKLSSALVYRDSCIQSSITVRVVLTCVMDEYCKPSGERHEHQNHGVNHVVPNS